MTFLRSVLDVPDSSESRLARRCRIELAPERRLTRVVDEADWTREACSIAAACLRNLGAIQNGRVCVTKSREKGLVRLDQAALNRACARLGLSRTRLADDAELARNTVARAFNGLGVFKDTALRIATSLGYDDPNDLISSGNSQADNTATPNNEWEVDEYLGPWLTASNQLQYRICRMRHRYLPDRAGRGKCYDLLNPATHETERLRECLLRHPIVCSRIGTDPRIPENLGTWPAPDNHVWWVVDRWVDGQCLEDLIESEETRQLPVQKLLIEIVRALDTLHDNSIVMRELSPSRIILANDGSIALTDFELARLLDATSTVSSDWLDDPWRAPEVECGKSTIQSDIYSWARIALRILSGELPAAGKASIEAAGDCHIADPVRKLLAQSLHPVARQRPRNAKAVLKQLRQSWRKSFEEQ